MRAFLILCLLSVLGCSDAVEPSPIQFRFEFSAGDRYENVEENVSWTGFSSPLILDISRPVVDGGTRYVYTRRVDDPDTTLHRGVIRVPPNASVSRIAVDGAVMQPEDYTVSTSFYRAQEGSLRLLSGPAIEEAFFEEGIEDGSFLIYVQLIAKQPTAYLDLLALDGTESMIFTFVHIWFTVDGQNRGTIR